MPVYSFIYISIYSCLQIEIYLKGPGTPHRRTNKGASPTKYISWGDATGPTTDRREDASHPRPRAPTPRLCNAQRPKHKLSRPRHTPFRPRHYPSRPRHKSYRLRHNSSFFKHDPYRPRRQHLPRLPTPYIIHPTPDTTHPALTQPSPPRHNPPWPQHNPFPRNNPGLQRNHDPRKNPGHHTKKPNPPWQSLRVCLTNDIHRSRQYHFLLPQYVVTLGIFRYL